MSRTQPAWNLKNDQDNMLVRAGRDTASDQLSKRFGLFPYLIDSTIQYTVTEETADGGRIHAPGTRIHISLKDLTLHPEADGHIKWVCGAPECRGKFWPNKPALVGGHAPSRELSAREAVHPYHAVACVPAVIAVPMTVDPATNQVLTPAIESRPAKILLLSDTEA